MRVLIVDDHPFIRKGVRETLVDALAMVEIEEATDGDQAFDILAARAFDLVIVDVSMPGKDGLELIKDTLAIRPGVRFLMMSVFPEREFAERAYRDGAMGYLDKASPPAQFLEAVRRILGGRTYVSPEYAETLVAGRERDREEGALLTDRELAVVARYSAGDSLMEIGRQLRLSVKTVSTYKTRAMEKLGLGNNAELIAYAIAHGLARPRSP
jgi:two-component system, NarL family, invasion response regulator UvrY